MQIAHALRSKNLSVEVVDPRFICPLDLCKLRLSSRCSLIVSLEDHVAAGGFGEKLHSALNSIGSQSRFLSIAWPPSVGFAENDAIIEQRCGQSTEQIFEKIFKIIKTNSI
jgi:1-deoxy-D-xylulose-5-phosphate synthase